MATVTGSATIGGTAYPASAQITLPGTDPRPLQGPTDSWNEAALGAFGYAGITNSNGYNTYVVNQTWGMGAGGQAARTAAGYGPQSVSAYGPDHWWCDSTQADHGGAVLSYPCVQQLFNDYSPSAHGFNTGPDMTDLPLSAVASMVSTYAETMHATPATDAEAAYDIWTSSPSGGPAGEIMIWVDTTARRGLGGARVVDSGTLASGQAFEAIVYGAGNIPYGIVFTANQQAGTVDILSLFRWMQGKGYLAADAALGQLNFGWEICGTGGVAERFEVDGYTLTTVLA